MEALKMAQDQEIPVKLKKKSFISKLNNFHL